MWAKNFHCDCKPATPQPMLVVEQNNLDIFYQRPKLFCILFFFLKINIVILRIFVSFYNHNFLFQMRKRFANVNFYAKYESLKEIWVGSGCENVGQKNQEPAKQLLSAPDPPDPRLLSPLPPRGQWRVCVWWHPGCQEQWGHHDSWPCQDPPARLLGGEHHFQAQSQGEYGYISNRLTRIWLYSVQFSRYNIWMY